MKQRNYYKLTCISMAVAFLAVMVWNGMPATIHKVTAHYSGLDIRFIEWCNKGDNMVKEPACNGGTVGMD